jgi:replicative superfamily II helicase
LWRFPSYVQQVGLMVIDEIHLLGADRGPILEVIVSRMRYVSSQTGTPIRFVGLSTALANARDLADWLGIHELGLFNFKPSVRPVPLEVHVQVGSHRTRRRYIHIEPFCPSASFSNCQEERMHLSPLNHDRLL